MRIIKILCLVGASCLLCQCAKIRHSQKDGAPFFPRSVAFVKDAVPKDEPKSRYGNPSSYVVKGKRYKVMSSNRGFEEVGLASWYGTKFHGRKTSNGEEYNMYAMTAAHKSLPLPTYLKVENLSNGKEVIVKVNDRGPFVDNRILDLSYAAAKKLGVYKNGTAKVKITAITKKQRRRKNPAPVSSAAYKRPTYIQVGAFKQAQNAASLKSSLHAFKQKHAILQNLNVDVQTPNQKNGIYKVILGPLANKEALENAKQLLHQGKYQAIAIQSS